MVAEPGYSILSAFNGGMDVILVKVMQLMGLACAWLLLRFDLALQSL